MTFKDLKEGTIIINPSGILFKIKHVKFKRKYLHTVIYDILSKKEYVRVSDRFCEIYDPNNKHHLRDAKKYQKEYEEYLIKKSKWSFNE